MEIKKLLIANRGEIAIRIIKTARQMGYSVVAVYSDQDKDAALVKEADESIHLKGSTLSETYLNIDAICKAAKYTNCDAIHPGYGFLSENPLFAQTCENEGINFVGPSSNLIRMIGNKIAAREIATRYDVPIIPGLTGNPSELQLNIDKIGYPLLIKAAAGGGGKGMRIVNSKKELVGALQSTSSEAKNYFGDGTVYVEKFFNEPRHIEVQVFGDKHGNVIHLFERECSVQRRHQKIIEEAPSPTLTDEVREKICSAAVKLASSIGYYSAGTIEFLVDKSLNFYFLEMNTRIQVEHPVTEMITGIDIVKEQFRVAEGKTLSISQEDVKIKGHAVEVRVYAEDPLHNFMPSPGKIVKYAYPKSNSIRMDDARLHDNSEIYSNYDPMISKVIASGNDRQEAIDKLLAFLPQYQIFGIQTNLSFLQMMLSNPDFIRNVVHTRYIDDNLSKLLDLFRDQKESIDYNIPLAAGLIHSLHHNNNQKSKWNEIGYWRLYNKMAVLLDNLFFELIIEKQGYKPATENAVTYTINGQQLSATLNSNIDGSFNIDCLDSTYKIYMAGISSNSVLIKCNGYEFTFNLPFTAPDDALSLPPVSSVNTDQGDIISPMPGKVLVVNINEGDEVKKGDLLMIIEAMKMENNILAIVDGTVDKVMVKEGDNVDTSTHLVRIA
jgi:acetyl-CoA carboxylase biotin carboxylase subunit